MSGSDAPGTREVAHRLFAAEFDDATVSYSESDEERAPKYVVTPSGARVNRLFTVGVLTQVEDVNEELLRARVVDPTGAFVTYAGQYQPDEMAFFDRAETPSFVALTGKARTYQPEDSDRIYTSVRPESVSTVDPATRDRWTVSAAEATLERVSAFDAALDVGLTGADLQSALRERGYPESLASGIPLAIEHYGTTRAYLDDLRRLAIDALEVVADDRDSVRPIERAPDEGGSTTVGTIPDTLAAAPTAPSETATTGSETESPAESEPTSETEAANVASGASTDDEPVTSEPAVDSDADASTEATTIDASAEPEPTQPAEPTTAEPSGTESTPDPDPTADTAPSDTDTDDLGDFDADGSTADESGAAPTTDDADGAAGVEGEMYELSEEERREVEENHDLGFESAADVGDPGEAGIDVPDADELTEEVDAEATDTAETVDAEATDTAETVDAEATDTAETVDAEATDTAETVDAEATDTAETVDAETSADTDGEAEAETAAGEPADTPETAAGEPADTPETAAGEPADTPDDLESVVVETMDELDDGDGAAREQVVAAVVEEYDVGVDGAEAAIESALMSGKCYEPTEDSLKAI